MEENPIIEENKKEMAQANPEFNKTADTSWLLGLLSIIFGVFISLAGLILGIIGLVKSKKGLQSERVSKAKAGRIMSIVGIIIAILMMVLSISIATVSVINYSKDHSLITNTSNLKPDENGNSIQKWAALEAKQDTNTTDSTGQFSSEKTTIIDDNTIAITFTFASTVPSDISSLLTTRQSDWQNGMQGELKTANSTYGVKEPKILAIYKNPDGKVLATLTATLEK